DLGALQVDEHGDRTPGVLRGAADVGVVGLVHGVVAVAEVQPRDVYPGIHECADRLVGRGCGSERGDDLGASQINISVSGGEDRVVPNDSPERYAGWRPIARSVGLTGAGSAVSPMRC